MKALVLAAGFGTRLAPLTDEIPKVLVPVVNTPVLEYNLLMLKKYGIREVIINCHHHAKQVKAAYKNGSKLKMTLYYSFEKEILGTGGGIKNVEDFFGKETFIVVNGDTINDVNLESAIFFHRKKQALATMVVREDRLANQYGVIEVDHEGRIRRLTNRYIDETRRQTTKTMFAGIHIFEPEIFEYIPPTINSCINDDTYPRLLKNNEPIYGFFSNAYWADTGTIPLYFKANMDMINQKYKLHYFEPLQRFEFSPQEDVDLVVRMGKDVKLPTSVQIKPPLIIGNNTVIKENCILGPNLIIGDNCEIGENSMLTDSIVWSGVKIKGGIKIQKTIHTKHFLQPTT